MVTIAVVSTATQAITQYQSAKHQIASIDQQLAATQKEIQTAEVAEVNERQRIARQEQARIKVAAGQAGLNISGSVSALLQDSAMQNSLARERTRLNAETQQNAAVAEANSMYSRVERPTILGTGLRLATAAGSAYYSGRSIQMQQDAAARGPR